MLLTAGSSDKTTGAPSHGFLSDALKRFAGYLNCFETVEQRPTAKIICRNYTLGAHDINHL